MRLHELEIKDFRQFYGEQSIRFSSDSSENITIIEGSNGAGKTNLFKALQWVLYGEQADIREEDEEELPIINEKAIEEMDAHEDRTVEVKLILAERHPIYEITRSLKFHKDGDGQIRQTGGDITLMEKDGGWDLIESPKDEETLASLLPFRISQFYFFDGERLDSYFRPGTEEDVRETVEDVSQIELLKESISHLDHTIGRMGERVGGNLGERLEEIREQKEEKEALKNEKEEKKEKIEEELKDLRAERDEIDRFFSNSSYEQVKELQQRREEKEEELNRLESEEEDIKQDLGQTLIEKAPLVLARDAIEETREMIDDYDEEVGLPPDIQEEFIRALLDAGECICGRGLPEDSEAVDNLQSILEDAAPSDLSALGMEGRYVLEDILSEDIEEFREETKELSGRWNRVTGNQDKLQNRLNDINDKMKRLGISSDDEDLQQKIKEKEERRENIKEEIDEKTRNHERLKGEIEEIDEEIEELDEERREVQEELDEKNELRTKLELMEAGQELLEDVKEEIMSEIREDIETKTEEQFFELIWKDNFEEVSIGEDYTIEVINQHGRNAINNLSAGERQALALSFMAALKQVSGYDFPVIIDTPLGRISREPRTNIAENLPDYLSDTQVTLLVTNTEYDEDFRERILPRVGKEYTLDFDEDQGITEVMERDG